MPAPKHPSEIEMSNRRFAIESAVKLGIPSDGNHSVVIENTKAFFDFLQENSQYEPPQSTGFSPE